jgi:hypothetical protein
MGYVSESDVLYELVLAAEAGIVEFTITEPA